MTEEELLLELEQAANDIGLSIRYEKGDFDGGYCILRDENIIIANKKLSPFKKCSVIAQALGDFGIDEVYIKPVVRTFIEDELVRASVLASKNVIKRLDHIPEQPLKETDGGMTELPARGESESGAEQE
jgi:hypothetical protein